MKMKVNKENIDVTKIEKVQRKPKESLRKE